MSVTVKQVRYFLLLARKLGIPYSVARSELERLTHEDKVAERIAELELMVRIHDEVKKDPGALRRLVLELCRTREVCSRTLDALRRSLRGGAHRAG